MCVTDIYMCVHIYVHATQVAKSPASAAVALEYIITPKGLEQVVGAVVPAVVSGSVIDAAIANEVDYGMYV